MLMMMVVVVVIMVDGWHGWMQEKEEVIDDHANALEKMNEVVEQLTHDKEDLLLHQQELQSYLSSSRVQQQRVILRYSTTNTTQLLTTCFKGWRGMMKQRRQKEVVAQHYACRHHRRLLQWCNNQWREYHHHRRIVKDVLCKGAKRWDVAELRHGWCLWQEVVMVRKEAEEALVEAEVNQSIRVEMEETMREEARVKREKAERVIAKLRYQSMSMAWKGWLIYHHHCQRNNTMANHFISRHQRAGICRCLSAWAGFVGRRCRARVLMGRLLNTVAMTWQQEAMMRWRSIHMRKEHLEVIGERDGVIAQQELSITTMSDTIQDLSTERSSLLARQHYLETTLEEMRVGHSHHAHYTVERLVGMMQYNLMVACFAGWKNYCHHHKRNHHLATLSCHRVHKKLVMDCFHLWVGYRGRRSLLRVVVDHAVKRSGREEKRWGWVVWSRMVEEEREWDQAEAEAEVMHSVQRAKEASQKEKVARRVERVRYEALSLSWKGWKMYVRQCRRATLMAEQLRKKHHTSMMAQCMVGWCLYVSDNNRKRVLMTRFLGGVRMEHMREGWRRWVGRVRRMVGEEKEGVIRELMARTEVLEEEKRVLEEGKGEVEASLVRLQCQREEEREKEAARLIRLYQHRTLHVCLNAWTTYTRDQRRHKMAAQVLFFMIYYYYYLFTTTTTTRSLLLQLTLDDDDDDGDISFFLLVAV